MVRKYDVLALDLDGTLTNSQKIVTPRTLAALRRAAASGVAVTLASGRPLRGVEPVAREVGLKALGGYMLVENGARILEAATGGEIFNRTLPAPLVPPFGEIARAFGVTALAYEGDFVVAEDVTDKYVGYEARNDGMKTRKIEDFSREVTWPCNKIMLVGDPETLVPCERYVAERFEGRLSVFRSEPYFLEILPEGIDKPAGLSRLLSHLGCPRERLMAMGDGLNDIGMLAYAGLGVAMENAYPQTKAAADAVTASNDEDGVAAAIDRYLFGEG